VTGLRNVSLDPLDPVRLGPPAGARMLVVGGCGGIGRALVAAALRADLRVAVMDLPAVIEQHRPPSTVLTLAADVTDEEAVRSAFGALERSWPAFDTLVNLAGLAGAPTPVEEHSPAEFERIVAGSLRGTFLVARAALPFLRAGGGGTIVHTASGLATNVRPGFGPYASAKAGVVALTKAVAREAAPAIRANCVAPGAVDTAFLRGGTGRPALPEHLDRDAYVRMTPLGRLGHPDDVVGPILFLAGPASRYMTGTVLYINGGQLVP
jgi:3-oxoacyl-[acyl-carrier protein] reductase